MLGRNDPGQGHSELRQRACAGVNNNEPYGDGKAAAAADIDMAVVARCPADAYIVASALHNRAPYGVLPGSTYISLSAGGVLTFLLAMRLSIDTDLGVHLDLE